MKTFRSILNLTGAFLLASQGLSICQADEAPVRIMPLGDSITQGCCSGSAVEGGYRNRLHDLLDSAGYTVDFVGTQNDVSNPALPDTDHQGMPGFQIEQLRAEIATWTKMVEDPDVILLHAGTNDFGAGAQVSTVQNRLQNLITDLSELRPHSHIFVSTLIPRTDNPAFEALQNSFNLSLPQLVSDQVALGRKVHYVDLHGALDPGDLNDGLHPTVAGYEKMADGWSAAVMAVTTPQGTSDLPAVARLDAREDLQHMTVRFSKPVEDAAAAVGNFQISGGVNILSASLDAASKRIVTLTTTPQQAGALHHLTVNGVRDRTAQQLEILPFTTRSFTAHSVSDASFEAGGATWTSSGNQAVVASAAQATDGSNLVVFNASNTTPNGILTQTVPTVPGQAYRLEFDLGVVDFVSASQSMHVTAVGNATLLDQTESLTGVGGGATRWTTKELEFVADSASTTITFEDVSAVSTNIDMLLDDIHLNAGGSPTLTVASVPSGAPIVVSPLDNGGNGDGTTQFERTFDESTTVNLTAPSTLGARGFDKWQRDGVNFSSSPSTSVTMEADHTMTVVYRLLTNGSFESGSPADVGDFNGDWAIGGTGKELNGSGTGSFKPFGYTEHLASSPPYDAFEGNRMAVFNGGGDAPFNGVIAQDITTVPGTTYSLSFQVGISSTTGGRKQRVTAAATGTGSLLSQLTEVTAPGNNTCTWTPVTHTFTADSTTTTISFTDSTLIATAGGSDLLIDDVVVEEVVPRTLTINSTPATGLSITVSPADNGSNSDGTTNFTRTYDSGTDVTLTAPATSGSDVFSKWQRDGVDFSINATAIVTMDADHTMTAVYAPPPSNLLVNGSFETGTELVATVHELESWNPLPSPTAAGTPFGYVADGSAYTTTDGLRIAVFNGGYLSGSNSYGGSISQTVTVTPGQTYDLSFDAGIYAASTGSKTQNFSVTAVGSGTLLSESLSRSTSVTGSAWAGETFSFVADSTSVTITFAGAASSASSDLLLDNVSLLPAAAGNSAPVAVDDSYAAVKNVPLNVSAPGVLDNDTDVDLDTLTATVVANPSNGSLTLNSDGSFTYTPTTDYVGPDSFTYTANDGTDDSNTATVTITVSEPTFELAVESSPATGIGITVSPADNGSNSDGATNFTRTYNGGTEVTLTAPSISATTVFEKWQRDGSDYTTEATAVVTMDADYTMTAIYVANTPPVAVDDSYSTTEDVDLEVAAPGVLDNDSDANGTAITAAVVDDPSDGSVTLNSDGSFTYEPDPGFTGTDEFTYEVSDGIDESNVATVTITVNPAAANLLVNGSFETGTELVPTVHELESWNPLPTPTAAGTPFGFVADGGAYTTTDGARIAVFNGGYLSGSNTYGGSISQTVTVTPGQTYDLSFDAGIYAASTGSKTQNFSVTAVGGGTLLSQSLSRSTSAIGSAWSGSAFSFVADSASVTITFTSTSGSSSSDLLLDNVSLALGTAGNSAPVAVDDSYSTNKNVALNVSAPGVLDNDSDVDLDTLTVSVVVNPAHGSVSLGVDGSFTYTPVTDYVGADSFTYKANDGSADSNIATVSITVNDTTFSGLANGSFEVGDDSSSPVTVLDDWTVVGNPIGYIADASYTSTDGLRIAVFNGGGDTHGGTISQTFVTTIGETYELDFDAGIVAAGTGSKTQTLGVTVTGLSTLLDDSVVRSRSGAGTTWSGASFVFTADDSSATITFTDVSGSSNSDLVLDHVRVQVASTNNAPVAANDSYSTTEDIALVVNAPGVLANDTDTDLDSLTAAVVANPSSGSLTLNADGSFTYTPNTGFSGSDSFTYVANDGTEDSNTATVSITVNAASPSLLANGSFEIGDSSAAPVTVLDSWTPGGATQPIGYIATAPYTATDPTATSPSRLAIFNPGGDSYTGTLSQSFTTEVGKVYSLVFDMGLIRFSGTGSKTQTLGVTVSGSGALLSTTAAVTRIGAGTTWETKSFSFVADSVTTTLLFADQSSSAANSTDMLLDRVSVSEITTAHVLTVNSTPVSSLAVTVSPADLASQSNGVTSFTRIYNDGASVSLTATAASGPNVFEKWQRDGLDFTTDLTAPVTMDADYTMTAVYVVDNDPRAYADSYSTDEDTQLSVSAPGVLGNDEDPNLLSITAVLDTTTSSGTLSLNADGSFTYDPGADFNGTDSFTYHATNGSLVSDPATVTITVNPINDPPTAVADIATTDEDVPVGITLQGSDPDGDPLTFVIDTPPANGAISGTLPNAIYTPNPDFNGSDSFTFTVNDGSGPSAAAQIDITVDPVADPPAADNQNLTMTRATSLAITLTATDPDVGTTLTYSVVSGPSNGTLSGTAPNLTYTPDVSFTGSDSFTFVANDGTADSNTATISISVNDILLNGSFEITTVPGTADFWTEGGNAHLGVKDGTVSYPAKEGTKYVAFNDGNSSPGGTISQTFATTPGQPYELKFWVGILAFNPNATAIQKLGVDVDGASSLLSTQETIQGQGPGIMFWQEKTYTIFANSASTTITFSDDSSLTNSLDLLLDDVRITPIVTRTLTIETSPDPGVSIEVVPADINSNTDGVSDFTRVYFDNEMVGVTAPEMFGSSNFEKWQLDGVDHGTNAATTVTMDAAHTLTAIYLPNEAPVTADDSYSTDEDVELVVDALTGVLANDSDAESQTMTVSIDTLPQHGSLVLNADGSFTYTPDGDFHGTDSFFYTASDGFDSSDPAAEVTITVDPVNDAPVADGQTDVPVVEETATAITLTGSDVDGDGLTYTVVDAPTNGALTGTAPNLTYTPGTNFFGSDSFTFTVNDGTEDSALATVTILVSNVQDAPVADGQTDVPVVEDTATAIMLTGSDVDGDSLTYTVVDAPTNGALSGTAPNLTYTPAADYTGADSFTFLVNDGTEDSALATVTIDVTPVNDTPIADGQTDVPVVEDTATAITLTGSDVDGDSLTYTVVDAPTNGALSGTAPNLTYTPAADYTGADSFTFLVNDGTEDSALATVTILVSNVQDAPVADGQTDVPVVEDTATAITLTGSDVDGDSLTYTVVDAPTNGALSGTAPNLTYTPAADYTGADSFTFLVNDGTEDSALATVTIDVTPVNDTPIADGQTDVPVVEDTATAITLTGSDVDGDSLTYTVVDAPTNGALSGTAPNLTYTPAADYTGADSFTFLVNDGTEDSALATVTILVSNVQDAPIADSQTDVPVVEDTATAITLTGSDVDGDSLTYTVVDAPTNGALSGTAPNLTYTPAADYTGADSFTFLVNDGTEDSALATVTIDVTPVNDTPVADSQTDVPVVEDTATAIMLTGSDVDGDSLTYSVVDAPTNGALSGTAPNLTYTPAADYTGADSFTFTVNDGTEDSALATVTIDVTPVNDTPIADSQSDVPVVEDTATAIMLTGSDVDGDSLTYTVVDAPTNGALSGTAPNLTYTPAADYTGADSFTFLVNDGTEDSALAAVTIDVTPVNDPPIADSQTDVPVVEDTATAIMLTGSDVDGDSLTYTVVDAPTNGALSGTAPNLTYTPAADYTGADSFTFLVNDGTEDSALATVTIDVTPVNDTPIADGQTDVPVVEDTATAITLTGSDVDGDSLTYTVVDAPTSGALSGTAPNLTYTPAADYTGADSFTFTVNDGTEDSALATVTIDVTPVNDPPIADGQTDVPVVEDTATAITLTGSDVDGDSLTYTVVDAPTNGALSGTAPNLTYTPAADYTGADSFTFLVNDGTEDSALATVTIDVTPVNDTPIADGQTDVPVVEDTATAITLTGSDVDGDSLTYTVVDAPTNGALSGTAPNLTYTPAADYTGADSFTFTVNDGTEDSALATVTIDVTPVNDTPIADSQTDVPVVEDTATAIMLTGSDVDGDSLTYTVVGAPTNGALSGTAPNLTYTPAADYTGADSFTFLVNDGTEDSALATVTIDVTPVNDTPIADGQTDVPVVEDTATAITLTGSDVDGDSLTYTVVDAPTNGALSGTAPNLTYTPAADYTGADSFTFLVNDGTEDSALATVTIDVTPVNDTPIADGQTDVPVVEDTATAITLTGSDVDGDSLTYTMVDAPTNGALSGTAPNLTYTPAADYTGADSFTFLVNDGTEDSALATVTIDVTPVNDTPIADGQTDVPVVEDTATAITLTGSDVDGDTLTYTVVDAPTNGALSGTAPNLTYTPAADYTGADSFTFLVNDGTEDSALATVTIDVTPVNDTPIADGQTDVPVVEDTATAITLTGSDVDGDSLTYTVVDAPTNGALSGTAPNLTYTPAADYTGADSFTFLVNDGTEDSALATVTIDVTPVNDIPVANAQPSVSVDENGSVPITLTGSDVDGDSLTFTVVGGPAHGALSGTAPDLTYTPATDYFGPDSFTFVANDGTVDSAPAEVTITVNEVAGDGWEEWLTENGITGAGAGVDSDDDSISNAVEYVIGGNPAGQNDTGLLPTAATVLADPDNDTNNSPYLVFTYRRTDRANDDPLVTIGVQWSTSLTGSWSAATDGVDGVVILTDDNHYEAGIDRVRVYIPRSLAVNGKLFARLGVEIDASSSIVAPQADDQSVSVDEDGSVAITLTGTDSNGDPLTYAVVSGPSHGTLTGTAPNLVYTPDEDYFGADSFLFTANDGGLDSPPATVSITVNPLEEFAQFMSSYGLTAGPNVDSDGDTILNSVEFVIGGNPANQANQNLLPFVSYVTADPDNNTVFDNYLLFTYRRTDDANTDPSTDIRVEWNAYLSGPWTNATDTPGTVVLETDDHYGAGVDRVQVYIPRSASPNGFMFTRFRVTVATP